MKLKTGNHVKLMWGWKSFVILNFMLIEKNIVFLLFFSHGSVGITWVSATFGAAGQRLCKNSALTEWHNCDSCTELGQRRRATSCLIHQWSSAWLHTFLLSLLNFIFLRLTADEPNGNLNVFKCTFNTHGYIFLLENRKLSRLPTQHCLARCSMTAKILNQHFRSIQLLSTTCFLPWTTLSPMISRKWSASRTRCSSSARLIVRETVTVKLSRSRIMPSTPPQLLQPTILLTTIV